MLTLQNFNVDSRLKLNGAIASFSRSYFNSTIQTDNLSSHDHFGRRQRVTKEHLDMSNQQLAQQLKETGELIYRDALLKKNTGLLRSASIQVLGSQSNPKYEDAMQIATIVFLRKIAEWDPEQSELSSYLLPSMRFKIENDLRVDNSDIKIPKNELIRANQFVAIKKDIELKEGRTPSDEEVFKRLQQQYAETFNPENVKAALWHRYLPSLNAKVNGGDSELIEFLQADVPEETSKRSAKQNERLKEIEFMVEQAIQELLPENRRPRQVIVRKLGLLGHEAKDDHEIAAEFNISEATVDNHFRKAKKAILSYFAQES